MYLKSIITSVLISAASLITAHANELDDKFKLVSEIDGINVIDAPEEECSKTGIKSAKVIMLTTQNQSDEVCNIIGTIDDNKLFLNVNNDDNEVKGWLVCESDDNTTILLYVHNGGNQLLLLCKGPKSMIDDIQIN